MRRFAWVLPLLWVAFACWYQEPQTLPLLARMGAAHHLGGDFRAYFLGARALQSHVTEIYGGPHLQAFYDRLGTGIEQVLAPVNPPPFCWMVEPWMSSSFIDSYHSFMASSLIVCALGLLALCRMLFGNWGEALLAAALASFCAVDSPMGVDCICQGQLGFWLIGLTALAFVSAERRWPAVAGFCVASLVFAKMWPLILLFYFARHKQWRVVGWSLGWIAALSAAPLLLYGWGLYAGYLKHTGEVGISVLAQSQSVLGVLYYHFGVGGAPAYFLVNVLVFVGGLFALARLSPEHPPERRQGLVLRCLELNAYCTLGMLCSAYSWPHHHLLTIIGLLAVCAWRRHVEETPWLVLCSLLLLWTLDGEIVQVSSLYMVHKSLAELGWVMALLVLLLVTTLLFLGRENTPDDPG